MWKTQILLVIEDEDFRTTICDQLISDGFKVFAAENVSKGLAAAAGNKPHLVLLDIDENLEQAVSILRLDDATKKVPVIMIAEEHRAYLANELGLEDRIDKSLDFGTIGQLVRKQQKRWIEIVKKDLNKKKLSVLVIDDEEDIRKVIALRLKLGGIQCIPRTRR